MDHRRKRPAGGGPLERRVRAPSWRTDNLRLLVGNLLRKPAKPSPDGLDYRLHHCCSQGTPSLLPSIFTPGQFFRKKVASAQEVI
jgi:hypothetical protein